ncbi:MAG: hypothetical protein R3E67_08860 [Pseudomonadales bacterium]
MSEASGGLAQKMYADAAAQQSDDAGAQSGGDDVVDAEFEEVKDK